MTVRQEAKGHKARTVVRTLHPDAQAAGTERLGLAGPLKPQSPFQMMAVSQQGHTP